jgi:Fur family transcriptional regulator, peroxide stress response regulator
MKSSQELKKRISKFTETCRKRGIKITPQRLVIYQIVSSTDHHPGPDEIYRIARKDFPTISLDTVYRTLWMLTELGLVSTVGTRRETLRFDANLDKHHHFSCVRCGLIRDFQNADLDALNIPLEALQFGRGENMQVEVRGVCADCIAKEKAYQEQNCRQSKPTRSKV